MRIIETDINDIETENVNESKMDLANDIISYVQPIFSQDYNKKIMEIKTLKKSLLDKKEVIKKNKVKAKIEQAKKEIKRRKEATAKKSKK